MSAPRRKHERFDASDAGTFCPHRECDGSGYVLAEDTDAAVPCRCREERVRRRRVRALTSSIPRRYRDVGLERFPIKDFPQTVLRPLRKYLRELDENLASGHGLWLGGDLGTGKTSAAALVAKEASARGHTVAFHTAPELLARIRDTFNENSKHTYGELFEQLRSLDLLVIDDMGTQQTKPWVLEQLYVIVNDRYLDERAIVMTTNLPEAELAAQVTPPVTSRLLEICGKPISFSGPDYRRLAVLGETKGGSASPLALELADPGPT
ncbi:MAG: ATP-binding protein [Actinomycetota bacterium]|nr:ATP-binding protein [Actinomycetota bacterium]